MKLSEMSTRKAAGAMAALAAPLGKLAQNEAFTQWIKNNAGSEISMQMALQIIVDLVPVFLRDNYNDTVQIIAILTDKTAKQVSDQSILQTIKDVKESFDGDLKAFFQSSTATVQAE